MDNRRLSYYYQWFRWSRAAGTRATSTRTTRHGFVFICSSCFLRLMLWRSDIALLVMFLFLECNRNASLMHSKKNSKLKLVITDWEGRVQDALYRGAEWIVENGGDWVHDPQWTGGEKWLSIFHMEPFLLHFYLASIRYSHILHVINDAEMMIAQFTIYI